MFNAKQLKRSLIGELGENLAYEFLTKKGYKTLERNYRKPWGEIDIICLDRDKNLVFVEVKTVNRGAITPEDQMTKSKINRLTRTAEIYTNMFGAKHRYKGIRIDLVGITIDDDKTNLKHYKGVV